MSAVTENDKPVGDESNTREVQILERRIKKKSRAFSDKETIILISDINTLNCITKKQVSIMIATSEFWWKKQWHKVWMKPSGTKKTASKELQVFLYHIGDDFFAKKICFEIILNFIVCYNVLYRKCCILTSVPTHTVPSKEPMSYPMNNVLFKFYKLASFAFVLLLWYML